MRGSTPGVKPFAAATAVAAAILVTVAGGCRRTAAPAPGAPASAPRIVSLSPAITRTLVDLGAEAQIVGRSAYCQSIAQSIPAVGDLYDIDYERLLRLDPTHLLLQPPSAGPPERLLALASEHGWSVGTWTINTIDDVRQMVSELPGAIYGPDDPRRRDAGERSAALLAAIDQSLAPANAGAWRGTTLLLAGIDPPTAFGRKTYLDDMLMALGGANAVEATGWPELSIEDLIRLDPGALIIVTDRGPTDPRRAAGRLAELDIAAVREGRVAVLAHPDASLPASSLPGVAAELRRILESLGEKGKGSGSHFPLETSE